VFRPIARHPLQGEDYFRISSDVKGQKLIHAGMETPIGAENAPRLAGALEELSRGGATSPPASTEDAAGIDPPKPGSAPRSKAPRAVPCSSQPKSAWNRTLLSELNSESEVMIYFR